MRTRRSDESQPLIDRGRIADICEAGFIDGGMWVDVLAVSYGPGDTTIRVRHETTGKRQVFDLPKHMSLTERLEMVADSLYQFFPYSSKPVVTMYRGHQARKFIKRLLADVDRTIMATEAAGILPEIGEDGIPIHRIAVEIPSDPDHLLN